MKIIFQEKQSVKLPWVRAFVVFLAFLAWLFLILQIILDIKFGNNPAPDFVIIIVFILVGLGLPCLMFSANLKTTITEEKIILKYYPFLIKEIKRDKIIKVRATDYQPIKKYGGWGIRTNFKNTRAYTTDGHRGVIITLKNGSNILIGSRKAKNLVRALK